MQTQETAVSDQPFDLMGLPVEVIRHILSFVDPKKLQDVRLTSSWLNVIAIPLMLQKLVEGSDVKDIVTGKKSTLILLKNGDVYGTGLVCLPEPNKPGFQKIPLVSQASSIAVMLSDYNSDSYNLALECGGNCWLNSETTYISEKYMLLSRNPRAYATKFIAISHPLTVIDDEVVKKLGLSSDYVSANRNNLPLKWLMIDNLNNLHLTHGMTDDCYIKSIPLDQPVMDVAVGRNTILLLTGKGDVYLLGQDLDVPDVGVMIRVPKKIDQFDGNARKIAAIDDRYYVVTKSGELFVLGRNYQPPPQIQSDDEQEEEEELVTPPKYSGLLGLGTEVTEIYGEFKNTGLTRVVDITVNKSITAVRCDNNRLYICGEAPMLEWLKLKADDLCVDTFAEVLPLSDKPFRFAQAEGDSLYLGTSTKPFSLYSVSNREEANPNMIGAFFQPAKLVQFNKLDRYNKLLQVRTYLDTCFEKAIERKQTVLWLSDQAINSMQENDRGRFNLCYDEINLLVPPMIKEIYEEKLRHLSATNYSDLNSLSLDCAILCNKVRHEIQNLRSQLSDPDCEHIDSYTQQLEIFEEIAHRLGMEIENPDTPTAGM